MRQAATTCCSIPWAGGGGVMCEIILKGLVLPIGGLNEKIIAAKQAGIKTVIIPQRNKKDIEELPKEAKSKIKFTFVKNANEILKIALKKK